MIINIILTLLASAAVSWLFFKMKIPGGVLVGAIVGTTILSLTTQRAEMPFTARFIAQVIAGAFIGSSIDREDMQKLKTVYKPFLIVIASLIVVNLGASTLVYRFSSLDYLTAMMCCIPGGMSDTPLIASELGAQMPPVVVLQFVRMVMGIGVFPRLIMLMTKDEDEMLTGGRRSSKRAGAAADKHCTANPGGCDGKSDRVCSCNAVGTAGESQRPEIEKPPTQKPKTSAKPTSSPRMTAATLLFAGVCGYIGRKLGVPSGTLLFASLSILALKLSGLPLVFPRWIKRTAQVLSGAYIGCSISMETLLTLPTLIVPACIIIGAYLLNAFITGNIIAKVCGTSKREGMLMVTPAGASDMALISADIGVNSPNLIVLQIARLLTVISVFPTMDVMVCEFLMD